MRISFLLRLLIISIAICLTSCRSTVTPASEGEDEASGEITNQPSITDNVVPTSSPSPSPTSSPEPTLPIGRLVFMSDRDGDFEIYALRTLADPVQLTDNHFNDLYPSWSPDSSLIAYHSSNGDDNVDIYVMGNDGTSQERLTTNPGYDRLPSWTLDNRIVFESDRDDGSGFYIMNADGTNQELLFAEDEILRGFLPRMSPDSEWIAFWAGNGSGYARGVYIISTLTGEIQELAHLAFQPAWSPDGTKIAFTMFNEDNLDIFMIDVEDKILTQLTDSPLDESEPAWSPDGNYIAFVMLTGQQSDIYYLTLASGEITQVTNKGGRVPNWGY